MFVAFMLPRVTRHAVITWLSADSEASVDASGFVLPCVFTVISSASSHHHPGMAAGCVCVFGRWWQALNQDEALSTLWSWVCKLRLHFCSSFLPICLLSIFCFFFVYFSRQQFLLCKISGNFTENLTSFSVEIPFILILTFAFILTVWPNSILKSQSKSHFNSSLHDIRPGFPPYLFCLN